MAFILAPSFAPAYQASQCNPFGFCAPASRPAYTYRVARPQPRRPQHSSFDHFFHQVDELLSEIDREAQRQTQLEAHLTAQRKAHQQRQQRKHSLRAKFAISQNEQGWQVDGDIQGFEHENISIDVTDEHTLKIAGNTQWHSEKAQPESQQVDAETTPEQSIKANHNDNADGVTAETATETETATIGIATPDSDVESHKSYQPTVEDDFEDLGAEASSLISALSRTSTPSEPREPKGKEKVIEEPVAAEVAVAPQLQAQTPEQQQQQQKAQPHEQERIHGSFDRTFRFPDRIDASNVSASFKDGALRITVPRALVPQVRRIAIL